MLGYTKKCRKALAAGTLFVVLSPAVIADPEPVDYVGRAKQLLSQLYPDLHVKRGLRAAIREAAPWTSDNQNGLSIELYDNPSEGGVSQPPCWCSTPVIGAHVVFISDEQGESRVFKFGIWGPFALSKRDKFAQKVNKHPNWSDAQVITALNDAGARFGPDRKAELLRAIPAEVLKPYVGGEIEVVTAFFSIRENVTLRKTEARLDWLVGVKSHGPGGQEASYLLVFEPFEGRLETISRQPYALH
jgi:hypothetical protein